MSEFMLRASRSIERLVIGLFPSVQTVVTFGSTPGVELVEFGLDPIFAAVDPHRLGKAQLRLLMIPSP
jgi:hypothetical protein